MMNLPIKFFFSPKRSFGLRRAAVWLVTGLALVAGIAGCGGSSTDTGSTNSTGVSGGTQASTVQKRFDYPNVIDASFGNKGTVSVNAGYSEKITVNGFQTHDFIVDRLGRIVSPS